MTEDKEVFKKKVSYSGIFNFRETYSFCNKIIEDLGYYLTGDLLDEDSSEEILTVEIKQNGFKKVSDYFKLRIKLKFLSKYKKVDAEKDGKKVKVDDGEFSLNVTGYLISDWENSWSKNPLWRFLRSIYDSFVDTKKSKKQEKKLIKDCKYLVSQLQSFLNMSHR